MAFTFLKPEKNNHAFGYFFWFIMAFFTFIGSTIYISCTLKSVQTIEPHTIEFDNKIVSRSEFEITFTAYMKKFNKNYPDDEIYRRMENLKNSMKEIRMLNAAHAGLASDAKYGFTKYSDMSKEEFEQLHSVSETFQRSDYNHICKNRYEGHKIRRFQAEKELPNKFDWRDKGYVTAIVDQGGCGSCWAHSVVGVMESMVQIDKPKHYNLYSNLSIQELLDCSWYNTGCSGGNPMYALDFLCDQHWPIVPDIKYHPLDNGKDPKKRDCDFTKANPPKKGVIVSEMWVKNKMAPLDIARVVFTHGPVTAIVNSHSWLYYMGGVIQYHCSSDMRFMNHVVQIVGYNMDAEVPYFILRNSYGVDWGDRGYLYTAMNGGVCGIGNQITYFNVDTVDA